MEVKFWLLDATYGVVSGHPEVRLFGVTENDERIVVLDDSFRPYFYVVASDPEEVRRRLRDVVNVELVRRKLLGRDVEVVKVTLTLPEKVREAREAAKRIPGVSEVLEADIRFYMRYLLDMGVKPSNWVIVDHCEEVSARGYSVDLACRAKSRPRMVEDHKLPRLRIMAFDIEVYNPRGTPNPSRDPIIIIAVMSGDGLRIFSVDDEKDDSRIIRDFVSYVRDYDPDIILGYNSNGFDWPYLVSRSKELGINLSISRINNQPEQSVYGHWSIIGRANVDLYGLVEKIPEIKVKSLDRAAEYFGVMSRGDRVLIPGHRIHEYWDDTSRRDLVLRYAADDVRSTYGLGEKLLISAIQLSAISGVPLDHVSDASVGARVEWMIFYEAVRRGELAPNREERPFETYRGAIVLEPRPGLHEEIAVLDFTSMYPSIMMKYNVSPDTLTEPPCDDCNVAPEVNYYFRRSPKGLYPSLLEVLVESRRRIRELMRRYSENDPEWVLLNERQRALKVMANAIYGYCGWLGARWYRREVAEAVTAWARSLLRRAVDYAKSLGLPIIYGDTDSLFVRNIEDKVDQLIKYVEGTLGFEIKIDRVYKRLIFTEAKKRYAGLTIDGKVDIVGFEAVRGDWAEIAKETQERVLELVLRGDVDGAVKYVRNTVDRLRSGRFSIDDVIIWKTLDKSPSEYKVLTPHLYAAKQLIAAGYKVGKGDSVGYVIVRGGGKVAQRAKPYVLVKDLGEIDTDYYIEKQILPAALRILGVLGIRESQIRGEGGRGSILDYF